jgi:hypothetical protein
MTGADEELGAATAAPIEQAPAAEEKPTETEIIPQEEEPQGGAVAETTEAEKVATEAQEPEKKKSFFKRIKETAFGAKKDKNEAAAAEGGPTPGDAEARAQAQAIGDPNNIQAAARDDLRARGKTRNSFISRGEDLEEDYDEADDEYKRAAEIAAQKASKQATG